MRYRLSLLSILALSFVTPSSKAECPAAARAGDLHGFRASITEYIKVVGFATTGYERAIAYDHAMDAGRAGSRYLDLPVIRRTVGPAGLSLHVYADSWLSRRFTTKALYFAPGSVLEMHVIDQRADRAQVRLVHAFEQYGRTQEFVGWVNLP
jgi:hypothetical protein